MIYTHKMGGEKGVPVDSLQENSSEQHEPWVVTESVADAMPQPQGLGARENFRTQSGHHANSENLVKDIQKSERAMKADCA